MMTNCTFDGNDTLAYSLRQWEGDLWYYDERSNTFINRIHLNRCNPFDFDYDEIEDVKKWQSSVLECIWNTNRKTCQSYQENIPIMIDTQLFCSIMESEYLIQLHWREEDVW